MMVPLSAAEESTQHVMNLVAVKLWVALVNIHKVLVEIQATPLPHNFPFFKPLTESSF
jgi:hypothetical protein